MSGLPPDVMAFLRRSQLLRVFLIGLFVLLLQIPITMIGGLIEGRRSTRDEAVLEVTRTWGRGQTVVGPALAVTYERQVKEEGLEKNKAARVAGYVVFLPDILRIEARVETEVRHRGIFKVPVYRMTATLAGQFAALSLGKWGLAPEEIRWERAQVWLGISDPRAIRNQATLSWDGRPIAFLPGTGQFGGRMPGIHAPLNGAASRTGGTFSIPLTINGSSVVAFSPLGGETTVHLTSNWPDPSFQGNWLPTHYDVTASGFKAEWSVPALGHNYPQSWVSDAPVDKKVLDASTIGVSLLTPIDPYRMAERSVKYEILFLLFTFLSLWMFEILTRCKIQSLQYLLVGSAMCLFYLLELSLAEHLGFAVAYLLASVAVVGLITYYCTAVLGRTGRATVIGLVVAGLYGFLYVLLRNQDYALLVGSIGLFVVLAVVMALTRRIEWNQVGS